MRLMFVFIFFLLIQGCASHPLGPKVPSLESIRSFELGAASTDNVLRELGPPYKKVRDTNSNDEIWIYLNGQNPPSTRASLFFHVHTKRLTAKNWFFNGNEEERDLEKAKQKFLGSNIRIVPESWKAHYGPDGVFYRDEESRTQVVYSKKRKAVTGVEWRLDGFEFADRKPAHFVEVE